MSEKSELKLTATFEPCDSQPDFVNESIDYGDGAAPYVSISDRTRAMALNRVINSHSALLAACKEMTKLVQLIFFHTHKHISAPDRKTLNNTLAAIRAAEPDCADTPADRPEKGAKKLLAEKP